ncbi:hypothetical protein SNE40_012486 [Patella caerulea]|uniref:Uncharacterized protein n=1 Tax=Patella caerulea TaxID=87958 RepID=A0AAN8JSH6_PATCE
MNVGLVFTDCAAGSYGDYCTSKCGNCADKTPCDIITGGCGLVGCVDGFQGPTCKDVQEPDDNTTIIAAAVSAVIAVIIISIVIFLVLKCRRRRKSTESDQVLVNDIPLKAKTDAPRPSEQTPKGRWNVL